jgi:Holliday junction resolvasome RuvABC endonuclease subunit
MSKKCMQNDEYSYLLSVDPSYRHTGIVYCGTNYNTDYVEIFEAISYTNKEQDMAKIYKNYNKLFNSIFDTYKIDFVVIDDNYAYPKFGIYAQKQNFGVVSLILSNIPDDTGYLLYNMNTVYSFFGIKGKNKKKQLHKKLSIKGNLSGDVYDCIAMAMTIYNKHKIMLKGGKIYEFS